MFKIVWRARWRSEQPTTSPRPTNTPGVTIPISSATLPPIVNNTGNHTFHEQYLSGTYYPSQSSQRTLPHLSWLACALPHKCCVLPPPPHASVGIGNASFSPTQVIENREPPAFTFGSHLIPAFDQFVHLWTYFVHHSKPYLYEFDIDHETNNLPWPFIS